MGLRILQDVDQMMDELSDVRQVPQGTLRIISSFGFGRRVVAPALSSWPVATRSWRSVLTSPTGWWI
jgi:DNA-binding transcriptional LysR family regulator